MKILECLYDIKNLSEMSIQQKQELIDLYILAIQSNNTMNIILNAIIGVIKESIKR